MKEFMTSRFWPADPETDIEYMQEALKSAQMAAAIDEVPVGAIVIDSEGKIIARAHNLRESTKDPLAHAELLAIKKAVEHFPSWRLEGASLFVTLEPCPMCLAACQQARIDRVVYGAKDPKGGALELGYAVHKDGRTHHRFKVDFVPVPRCSTILSEFFQKKRAN